MRVRVRVLFWGRRANNQQALEELQQRLRDFEDKSKSAAEVQDHATMAQELLNAIKAAGIKNVATLEQTFATNLDAAGQEYT